MNQREENDDCCSLPLDARHSVLVPLPLVTSSQELTEKTKYSPLLSSVSSCKKSMLVRLFLGEPFDLAQDMLCVR
jgi:hypothetical protein